MTARRVSRWIVISAIALGIGEFSTSAQTGAAQPEPTPSAAGCAQPIQCAPSVATDTSVSINLKPEGNVCGFEQEVIDDLHLNSGGSVSWTFCNECAQDMVVQMETPSPGPFKSFRSFLPFTPSDNRVSVNVRCYDYSGASGISAISGGTWKYTLRARPAASPTFSDEIDPRLEIDEFFVPPNLQTPAWLVVGAIVGAIVGYWLARRARSAY